MNIQMNGSEQSKVMQVEGRIDTNTAPEFEAKLLEELAGASTLRIDLAKVVYVSSAGLRAFLNGQKYANKNKIGMSLLHVSDTVMEVFEMTGFADILTIE